MEDFDLRSQILDSKDISEVEMVIPEWNNAKIVVRELNGADRADVMNQSLKKDGLPDLTKLYPLMVIKSVRYPADHKKHGERVFSVADRDSLGQKSGAILERIGGEAMRISGMGKKERDEIQGN